MPSQKNKTSNIILISPITRVYSTYLPFALLYLSSYLESCGISTKIIDLKIRNKERYIDFENRYINTILKSIDENEPLLIGLTCFTAEYNLTMKLAQTIRNNTNTPIVVGGIHATLKPQEFIFSGSPVDFAVIGEGETPLFTLVNVLKNKYSFKKLKSTAYLGSNNKMQVNGVCNVEKDLSKFPMPNYDKIDMNFYIQPCAWHVRPLLLSGIQIITSRGCPYSCDFCANNYLRSKNKGCPSVRYRPIDQIIEELELLVKKYKIDGFYVIDDCFMILKERTVEFCEKLIKKGLNLVWGAETRVNFVTDENLLKLMKKSGLIQLDFGVESGSPSMLKEINKQQTVKQIEAAFKLCKKVGIRTFANIMFNLPNETEEDVILTEKLLNNIKPSVLGMALTVPLLGTKIYEEYVFPKLTPPEYELYNKDPYYKIVDDRFMLAKYTIDFKKLTAKLRLKYGLFGGISLSPIYLRKLIKSKYLRVYITKFIKERIKDLIYLFNDIDRVYTRSKIRNFIIPIVQKFGILKEVN